MTTAQIFEFRPTDARDVVTPAVLQAQFARRSRLDPLSPRRQLACYWCRDREGRLAGMWEADIDLVPQL